MNADEDPGATYLERLLSMQDGLDHGLKWHWRVRLENNQDKRTLQLLVSCREHAWESEKIVVNGFADKSLTQAVGEAIEAGYRWAKEIEAKGMT